MNGKYLQGDHGTQTRIAARSQAQAYWKRMSDAAIDQELYSFMESFPISWKRSQKIEAILNHRYGKEETD